MLNGMYPKPVTVAELIEQLRTLPPDLEVRVSDADTDDEMLLQRVEVAESEYGSGTIALVLYDDYATHYNRPPRYVPA
jgi:hypothetical protein